MSKHDTLFNNIYNHILYENTNNKKLEKLVWNFRKEEEKFWDWHGDKECFKGKCQSITKKLADFLNKHNYKAKRVGGYYTDVSDDFEPDMSEWDIDDIENFEENFNNEWKHWWVEINNKYIVDITSDQFHPNDESNYRVIITNKNDKNYKKLT